MYDLLITNGTLVTKDRVFKAEIAIKDGKYAGFFEAGNTVEAKRIIDAKGNYVFPGIIDCHAHLNEPGFDYREDYETGTRAAAVAGCTCLIDMPLNNDPSLISEEIFNMKLERVKKRALIDFALWGGIVGDYNDSDDSIKSNVGELVKLHNCGVAAFKGFTCPNGNLFPTVNLGNIRKALEVLRPYEAICGFHCEEYGQVLEREKEAKAKSNRSKDEKIRDFLDAHDVWTEYVATKNILDMCRATGGRVHICHVSHPMVAQEIKEAMHEGLPVTAETCPHYLLFDENFVFEKGAPAKCTPPMRKTEDKMKLWNYVLDGTLSCIGSDHSPAANEEKDNETKDIWSAWGGLNTIQYFLPMMFDFVVNQKKLSPTLIAQIMVYNPAKVFGLYGKKGDFQIGFDGDVVIVNPDLQWKCKQEELLTTGKVSCLNGLEGKGAPIYTIIRGNVVA